MHVSNHTRTALNSVQGLVSPVGYLVRSSISCSRLLVTKASLRPSLSCSTFSSTSLSKNELSVENLGKGTQYIYGAYSDGSTDHFRREWGFDFTHSIGTFPFREWSYSSLYTQRIRLHTPLHLINSLFYAKKADRKPVNLYILQNLWNVTPVEYELDFDGRQITFSSLLNYSAL